MSVSSCNQNIDTESSDTFHKKVDKNLHKCAIIPTLSVTVQNETSRPGCSKSSTSKNLSTKTSKNSLLPATLETIPKEPEVLTVDNIEITYDLTNKNNDCYIQKGDNKWSKILKLSALVIATILFGVVAETRTAFSCFLSNKNADDTSAQDQRDCSAFFVHFVVVLLITAAQLMVLVPMYVWPIVFTFVRILQICGLLLIKFQIHQYLQGKIEIFPNAGYVGYMFLSGSLVACFTTEFPGKGKKSRTFYASLISVLSGIALIVEIGMNVHQAIFLTDALIALGSLGLPYIIGGLLLYFTKSHKHFGESLKFILFLFIVGHIALMYILLPAIHFEQIAIQIGLYSSGLLLYVLIFVTHQYFRFH